MPKFQIPLVYLERSYYQEPINKSEKVCALLRDALLPYLYRSALTLPGWVIQNKQHLAAVLPSGRGQIFNLLRWGDEIWSWEDLNLPPENAKTAGVSSKELSMARQLVDDMSGRWDQHAVADSFKEEILALVDRKVQAGQFHTVFQLGDAVPDKTPIPFGAQILNLPDLLQRSARSNPAPGLLPGIDGPKAKFRKRPFGRKNCRNLLKPAIQPSLRRPSSGRPKRNAKRCCGPIQDMAVASKINNQAACPASYTGL